MSLKCPMCRSKNTHLLYRNPPDYDYGTEHVFNINRCKDCGIIHIEPMPTMEDIFKMYPDTYYTLSPKKRTNKIMSVLEFLYTKKSVRSISKLCGENGRVLDVGCGSGSYMLMLRKYSKSLDLYGIDIKLSKDLLERDDIHFTSGDLLEATLPENYFDVIMMNNFIEHVTNPGEIIAKSHSLLKKGGVLVGEVPNGDSYGHKVWKSYWGPLHTPRHLFIFNKENLTNLFKDNGFGDLKVSYSFRPSGWAKSTKNVLVNKGFMKPSDHTSRIYPFLILINAPFFIGEFILRNSSIMTFSARK